MTTDKYLAALLIIVVVIGGYLIYSDMNRNNSEPIIKKEIVREQQQTHFTITPQSEQSNFMDRFFNPLRYPYKSPDAYYTPPFQVIGCGGRNQPCMNGITPIPNPLPGIPVGPESIAPVNIYTRGPIGIPQQVGVIYRVDSHHNEVYPLFGRKKYPNGDKYEYYVTLNQPGLKIEVPPKRNYQELMTNDIIILRGVPGKYRVTIYDSDFPQYIPYA